MSLPLDSDGFLRRECPKCELQFKWLPGGTGDEPDDYLDPPVYHCPYCGVSAPPDQWWTRQQLDYAQTMMAGSALGVIRDQLDDAFKGMAGGPLGIGIELSSDEPEPPDPLVEPDDMQGVQPPCHPWEPVKLDEDMGDSAYCLVCGARFAF